MLAPLALLLQVSVLGVNTFNGPGFSFRYPGTWTTLESESGWRGDNVILGQGPVDAEGLPRLGLMVSLVTERKKLRVADPTGRTLKVKGKLPFNKIVRRIRRRQRKAYPQVTQLKDTEGRWTIAGRQALYKDWLRATPEGGVRGRDVFIDDPQGVIVLSFVAPEADFAKQEPVLRHILASLQFPG